MDQNVQYFDFVPRSKGKPKGQISEVKCQGEGLMSKVMEKPKVKGQNSRSNRQLAIRRLWVAHTRKQTYLRKNSFLTIFLNFRKKSKDRPFS